MAIQYTVTHDFMMQLPNSKAVAVNASPLFLVHILRKYVPTL